VAFNELHKVGLLTEGQVREKLDERAIVAEAQAARAFVHLVRGEAEVREHAVDAFDAEVPQHIGQLIEVRVNQAHGQACEHGPGQGEHRQILVEADEPAIFAWRRAGCRAVASGPTGRRCRIHIADSVVLACAAAVAASVDKDVVLKRAGIRRARALECERV
jgi:hypothetical protein